MSDQSQGEGWWIAADGKWYPPAYHPANRQAFPEFRPPQEKKGPAVWAIVLALVALIVTVLVVTGVLALFVGSVFFGRPGQTGGGSFVPGRGDSLTRRSVLPAANLTVFTDGCGVIRSELPDEPQGLTWSIEDSDGFEVLSRNAAGETHYRYFQGGTYTVVLEAFDGNRYVPISNTVTINC